MFLSLALVYTGFLWVCYKERIMSNSEHIRSKTPGSLCSVDFGLKIATLVRFWLFVRANLRFKTQNLIKRDTLRIRVCVFHIISKSLKLKFEIFLCQRISFFHSHFIRKLENNHEENFRFSFLSLSSFPPRNGFKFNFYIYK
jgi:hypothetical protein